MAWIRSQDKNYLMDGKEIFVFKTKDEHHDVRAIATDWAENFGVVLGTFSTIERALDELNRIHDWITLQNAQGVYQVSQEDK